MYDYNDNLLSDTTIRLRMARHLTKVTIIIIILLQMGSSDLSQALTTKQDGL